MNAKRPRRLDLNAPLISTRRSTTTTTTTTTTASSSLELSRSSSLYGSSERVPFSWEQSPGKPKDTVIIRRRRIENTSLPLPKPPPIRWAEESTVVPHDEGCDGDVDDDHNDHDNCFSDAIDLFSLAGSLTTSEKLERENTREDVDWESDIGFGGDNNNGSFSPNFMIQRFLPAATALAASSLTALAARQDLSISNNNKHIMSTYPTSSYYNNNSNVNMSNKEGSCVPIARVAGQAYTSSSKGCGLVMLFPWRAKHKVCGIKSPVRKPRSSFKPQLSPRHK